MIWNRITSAKLFRGCMISSIAHAIMMNVYPEFAYEQSWDGHCFSMQDGSGARGTISFYKNLCVGAIRNEKSFLYYNNDIEQKLMSKWSETVKTLARKDALQYVLDEQDGIVQPVVSTMFWAGKCRCSIANSKNCKDDWELFYPLLLSKSKAIAYWGEYYEMDSSSIRLLCELVNLKGNDLYKQIHLNDEQIKLLPSSCILKECIDSFQEIGIYMDLPKVCNIEVIG